MSASAPASSSVALAHSDNSDGSQSAVKRPRTGAGSRGSYSSRVCQRCRKKKHKCLLDDAALDLPSSPTPIPHALRCTRCRESGLDCVLYEDEGGAKRRRVHPRGGRNSAAAATQAQTISPLQSADLYTTVPVSSTSYSTLASYAPEGSTSSVSASPVTARRTTSSSSAAPHPTPSLASSTATQQLALFHPGVSFTDKDRLKAYSHAVLYGTRSIEMLSQLLVRTPGWCSAVGYEDVSKPPASPCQLVDDALSQQLEPWVDAHVLWHPELPSLPALRAKHLESSTTSTALLLSTLYFITLSKLTPQPPNAHETLSRLALCVRREAFTVTMGAPGTAYAVLALMLISQYAPSTMLSPLPAGEIRGTSAIVGRGLLATATHIAQLIKLHNAPLELRKLLEVRQQLSSASAADEVNDRALVEALDRVSLWFNLKRWCATLALEEEELNVPPELVNLDGVELLLFDADAHRGLQPCELDTMRTAGRMMLHSRLNMARLALMHAEAFDFSDDLERVRPPVQRVSTATATVAKLGVEVKEEIDRVRLVLAPLVQNCPSVSVLLQWMQLEPLAWHSTILRISWIYVIWGCRASVWHDSRMGPHDLAARMRASEPIQHYSRDHADVRSELIERLLLGFTDLACSSANAERRTRPGIIEAVNAAVAALPTLSLCSMVVSQAKAELDEKAATMATIRQLGANTARQLSLVRFASHCLREMDAAFKRGEIDVENGVRAGSLFIASATLCSSMAETIAEWKSHVDAQASAHSRRGESMPSGSNAEAGPSHSSVNYVTSLPAHAHVHGHFNDASAPQAPYHLYSAPTQDHHHHHHAAHHHTVPYPATAQQLDDQAFVDSLTGDPGQWNFLLTNWLDTSDAAHAQASPFDWASVFGLPGAHR